VVTVTTAAPATTAPTFSTLVSDVRSGIVRIETTSCAGGAIGTGFLLSPRLVATVEHVVDGAFSITLKQNGRVVGHGTVVGEDAARDLALIRSDRAIGGHEFALAGRAPALGEDVAALGFPLGLPLTVTRGSVSGSDRTVPIDGLRRRDLVQTDAAVNPGNSGGPLIADDGSVVGLVDLGTSEANGLAFAVSSLVAKPLLTAWKTAPQPVSPSSCTESPAQVAAPSPAPTTTQTSVQSYDGANFSVDYPGGFAVTAAEVNKGTYYDTTIANGDYLLRVDENPTGGSGGVDAAAAPVLKALRAESGYTEIGLTHTTFEGYPALRWEFEVPEGDVLLHKTDTFFIGDNGSEWAILAQAPASTWNQVSGAFGVIESSFVEKD
jgi:S1-C subfamily serine protease